MDLSSKEGLFETILFSVQASAFRLLFVACYTYVIRISKQIYEYKPREQGPGSILNYRLRAFKSLALDNKYVIYDVSGAV